MRPEVMLLIAFILITQGAQMADEDGRCFKMEQLGNVEGNTYHCTDPDLPLCCQTDDTFTCCESEEEKTLNDQVMLWGFVCLTLVAFAILICVLTRQGDVWESETFKLAASNMARKLGMNFKAFSEVDMEGFEKMLTDDGPTGRGRFTCHSDRDKVKGAKGGGNDEFYTTGKRGSGTYSDQSTQAELQKMPLSWF